MKEAGFTLVELLVALVVGSILLVSLTSVVTGLAKDVRRLQIAADISEVEAIAPTLRTLIENAVPSASDTAIILDSRHLSLVVPPPKALGKIGPVKMDLTVVTDGKGDSLMIAFEAMDDRNPVPEIAQHKTALAQGFRKIRIDTEPNAENPSGGLPGLIKIGFSKSGGEPMMLAFRPRLSSTGACRFDPISMTCRA